MRARGSRTDNPTPRQLAYEGPRAELRDRRVQFAGLAREVGVQFPSR
jgi:hypothetical protein